MYYSKFLNTAHIERIRIPEDRDIINGIRCNRNERVEYWDEDFIREICKDLNQIDLTLYPDLSKIYKAIAEYENIEISNLLIGSGIDGIIKNIFETYSYPNMNVGVLSPTYAMYYVYSKLFRCNLVEVGYNLNAFKLRLNMLEDALNKVDLLFIPNPNQPIEDNFSFDYCLKLAAECKKKNILLIFDEAYFGFGCPTAKELIRKFNNVGVMRTFSKGFGVPSLRVGYIMAEENLIKKISQKRLSYETNSISQKIILNLLNNVDYIKKYNKEVCKSRDKLKINFKDNYIRFNSDKSNYILIDLKNDLTKKIVIDNFTNEKIYTKSNFKRDMKNYILMTIGPINIMKKIENIIIENS